MVAFFLSIPMSFGPLVVPVVGSLYLRSLHVKSPIWIGAWTVAAAVPVAVQVLLVRAVVVSYAAAGRIPTEASGSADWAALLLALGFVLGGATASGVVVVASRRISGGSLEQPGAS
jgi:hypothetical protein